MQPILRGTEPDFARTRNDDPGPAGQDSRESFPEGEDETIAPPFDFRSLLEAVAARWRWVAAIGILSLLVGLGASLAILRPTYQASVQLSHNASPLDLDAFKSDPPAMPELYGMISSPDALQKAGSELTPPISGDQLAGRLVLTEDRTSELITVTATGRSPSGAVALANLFSLGAVRSTQVGQRENAVEAGRLVAQQLAASEADSALARQQLAGIETLRAGKEQALRVNSSSPSAAKEDGAEIIRLQEKTQAARDELADLQARYTEAHPLVREQRARMSALEAQLLAAVNAGKLDSAASAPGLSPEAGSTAPDQSTGYDALVQRLGTLEAGHADLVARQRAIQLLRAHPPGYLRVMHNAEAVNVIARHNRLSIGVLSLLCGALGCLAAMVVLGLREILDDRLKTGADVRRVTGLPLLATLGNLDSMSPANQANWAFRTWTALQHRLSMSANHGLVCGITSSGPGEGRSTWIALLSKCARQCGFSVLTISSSEVGVKGLTESPLEDKGDPLQSQAGDSGSFSALVTTSPDELLEKLSVPALTPSVNLPLPSGWIWDLDRRKQWQRALNSWRAIDNIVILVELPPVSDPETVLLAENMPNLIWLTESHRAGAAETTEQLETLRNARCRLVGAVLNRAPASRPARRMARWFGRRSSLLASIFGLMGGPASAQVQAPFGVVDLGQRAPWQQRYTLGPGDLLDLSVFSQPELTQTQVPVGPDGRISYLEAQNIMAAGRTVDEFRAALNTELGKFRSAPEVIVIPASYRSKRYFMLGAVVTRGVFTLDRPRTLIEAVAQADGLEMEMSDHNLVSVADLSRSFIARHGRHLPVDFEALFLRGDLSQNIFLEPDDYIYFPAGDRQQIYVLGEVHFPGTLAFSPLTGTLEAIAVRGGFSERAWQKRLLVIRGSLNHPQSFVVNAADVLSGKTPDFQLEPRDIVYVSSRPWIDAEDLLDAAAAAFVQSAVITATGLHVDPIGDR
jgi:protein involved in polysaccharide export with SLBB domain/capsular polysaccharide biosynthesis protein